MNEQSKIWNSFMLPFFWVSVLWLVHYLQIKYDVVWTSYGIYPKTISGLKGILFSPFLHGDFNHLISNSVPLLLLAWAIIYFYKEATWRVVLFVFILSGVGTWIIGRPSYHIGASSLVYGFSFFLFSSGVIRKNTRLLAVSLLVVFIYGGLVWGLLPIIEKMSWEGHVAGSLSGIIASLLFRNYGPQRKVYEWEKVKDEDYLWDGEKFVLKQDFSAISEDSNKIEINYIYKKESNDAEED
ncbi:MAG TPA: rhomboid family intramembrane serine protease [Bacteroidia bacterium]|nr:rhomboid family intramembrane serine protease [Bacteroidia bacterium]HNT79105.1 rhomboid family intramembrane serine protease [Bacteroidia bacterium]